jgi:hypothetical protein
LLNEKSIGEISDLRNKNTELESENKELKSRFSSECSNDLSKGGVSNNSQKIPNDQPSKIKTLRKNWMDEASNNNLNMTANKSSGGQSIQQQKEEETLLQKEQLLTKRLRNEIERLNDLISSLQSGNGHFSNNQQPVIKEIKLDSISIEEKIGEGGFAVINKGQWMFLDVAVKVIFDPKITEDLLEEFNNEIKMLSLLKHPNIVSILGICKKPKLAIITEHVSRGSLFNILHKQR